MGLVVELEDHRETLARVKSELSISSKGTAVVTVDMHRGHLDPTEATRPVPPGIRERVVEGAQGVVQLARVRAIPVVHVVLSWRPIEAHAFNPRVRPADHIQSHHVQPTRAQREGVPHNIEGSIQCEVMPEIGPADGDYLIDNKKTRSSFLGTELDILLRRILHVDTILLMGINTDTCVLNAAIEGCNLGYKVVVVEEGVASSHGEDMHTFALHAIARSWGWVVSTAELEEKLSASEDEALEKEVTA